MSTETETTGPTETTGRRRWRLPALLGGVALLAGLGIGIAAQAGIDGHFAGRCTVAVSLHSTDPSAASDAELAVLMDRTIFGPVYRTNLAPVLGDGQPSQTFERCPGSVLVEVRGTYGGMSATGVAITVNPATAEILAETGALPDAPRVTVTKTAAGIDISVPVVPKWVQSPPVAPSRTNTLVINPGIGAAGPVTVTTHPTDGTPPMTTTVGVKAGSARLDLGVMTAGTVTVHRDGVADLTLPVTDGQLQMPANPNTQTGWKLQQIGGDTCAAAQPAACETTLTITPTEVK